MKRLLAIFCVIFLLVNPCFSDQENNTLGIPKDLDQKIQTALDHLFNMKFDSALKIFDTLKDQEKGHPMIAFGITCTHWWRLSTLVLETDLNESREFLRTVKECTEISKKKMQAGDPRGEGQLVLGGTLGLLGRWQATNGQYVNAYFTGKKAYRYLCNALEVNPNLHDANLGKGIFDYYVATLPAIVRILAFLGQGGDRSVGLSELEDASNNSLFARTAAKLFLVEIYSNLENKPDKALEILDGLRNQYPFSPFIQTLSAVSYYNNGDQEKLSAEADTFLDRVDKGAYPADFLAEAFFLKGASLFRGARFEEARQYFTKGLETKNSKSAFYTWSYLYRGYCLDALNQRDEAIKDYKAVLNQLRRWESWDHANQRLSTPFSVIDEEMKKLKL